MALASSFFHPHIDRVPIPSLSHLLAFFSISSHPSSFEKTHANPKKTENKASLWDVFRSTFEVFARKPLFGRRNLGPEQNVVPYVPQPIKWKPMMPMGFFTHRGGNFTPSQVVVESNEVFDLAKEKLDDISVTSPHGASKRPRFNFNLPIAPFPGFGSIAKPSSPPIVTPTQYPVSPQSYPSPSSEFSSSHDSTASLSNPLSSTNSDSSTASSGSYGSHFTFEIEPITLKLFKPSDPAAMQVVNNPTPRTIKHIKRKPKRA